MKWNLVLGGSHGIGYAYAKRLAKQGASIHLVARSRPDLEAADAALRRLGAASVQITAGDLTSTDTRRELELGVLSKTVASVFVGGPSPSPGSLFDVTDSQASLGCQAVLVYPLWAMRASLNALQPGGYFVLLSSSAVDDDPADSPFGLSAVLRRALSAAAEAYRRPYSERNLTLAVWKPAVVLTRLSRRYVNASDDASAADVAALLAERLGRQPLDADAYVSTECSRLRL